MLRRMPVTAPTLGSAVTPEIRAQQNAFIRSAFGWMFSGLLLTAMAGAWVAFSAGMQQLVLGNPIVFWGLVIAELGLVFWLSFRINHMSAGAAASAFFVYAFLNGLTLSVILSVYSTSAIMLAFVSAAGMFGAMATYGLVTKRDLTSWGSFFFMGLIGLLIAMVANFFFRSSMLDFMISVIGVFIFVGLTAYDAQKLKSYAMVGADRATNYAVIGALALYLDFINLFLMLLRLFGGRRS